MEIMNSLFLLCTLFATLSKANDGFPDNYNMPLSGSASVTHYDLPLDFVAACGCTNGTYLYPVAALSRMAYGSSSGYGPGCGRCFRVTLKQPVVADPPFILPESSRPSAVFKIVDACPSPDLCLATEKKQNSVGETTHFDIFSPSPAIPITWFPSDEATYHYTDFGTWYADYESVSCTAWGGYTDPAAQGTSSTFLDPSIGCCPADPLTDNQICPVQATAEGTSGTSANFQLTATYWLSGISAFMAFCFLAQDWI
ncbi:hypothetical protein BT69DRAFT_1250077 [Atractiella rhizophila]|nr:hypothetical protein BT69DRAFT_1250077 [Atractiella rhizophila]